jgi:hypothetical protein
MKTFLEHAFTGHGFQFEIPTPGWIFFQAGSLAG